MAQANHETVLLFKFLRKIQDYEPSLYDIIKKYYIYTFKSNEELRDAVKLYITEDSHREALERFNHISLWDVSNITCMRRLFSWTHNNDLDNILYDDYTNDTIYFDDDYTRETESFNENINLWDVSNVENMEGMFERLA